jgi:LPXTG-motif cell wall-anchored protein
VSSLAFTPTVPGTYRWIASYSGDANNAAAAGVCGDPSETTEVASTPDLDVDLPATGPESLRTMMTLGGLSLLLGLALLNSASRRRQLPTSR